MNKKILFIVFIALLAVILGVVLSYMTKPTPIKAPIIRYAAPPPATTFVSGAPTGVRFVFQGDEQIFPTSLPLYQFSTPNYSKNQMSNIAKSLGFTGLPTVVQFGQKSNTSWSMPTGKLSLYSNGVDRVWSHALILSQNRALPTTSLSFLAKAFIEKTFLSNEYPPLFLQEELAGSFEDMQINDTIKPKLYGYSFAPKIDGQYVITTSRFELSAVSCVIDEFGIVRSFSFTSPPMISQAGAASLISIPDAVSSLNNNRGILVFASRDNKSYLEEKLLFQTTTLTGVQLIYYPDNAKQLLVPYYIFTGQAISEGKPLLLRYAVAAIESY